MELPTPPTDINELLPMMKPDDARFVLACIDGAIARWQLGRVLQALAEANSNGAES